ncbi:class I SAM-dependent methyltransferase [Phenylobacterium sp.]|uniref:class I SAM-dependent methyltransferase n=1 Tax=Phenylobacterium sp. TaxID=1871053 RepID=UPI002FE36622
MSVDLNAVAEPPMPPLELRRSVGHDGTRDFENPYGDLTFGADVPIGNYASVLDFGCGCGRVARQMMLQKQARPGRYLGVDLYEPSIRWCRDHLTRFDPAFRFEHMNVANLSLNPKGKQRARIPTDDRYSLVNAHSVFTHIIGDEVEFYFEECRRSLEPDGVLRATWFLFDKAYMPMMQDFQNALYVNATDPTNAVIYDHAYVRSLYRRAGLRIYAVHKPAIRGFQWLIYAKLEEGEDVDFPFDDGPLGVLPPPLTPEAE